MLTALSACDDEFIFLICRNILKTKPVMNYKYINTLLQVAKRSKAQLSTSKINKSEDAKFLRYLAFLLETDSKI